MLDSTNSWEVCAPRRMQPWVPLACVTIVLWLLALWAAYDVHRGEPPQVFSAIISAAAVFSIITTLVGLGTNLARNQVAMAKKLDQLSVEQRQLFTALGENTGAFQQLAARVAQLTDPQRVDWPSYTAGAADALGVDKGNLVNFPLNGRTKG